MINYYKRPGDVHVKINNETFEITNVLNLPTQKTISILNSQEYYNMIISNISTWQSSDEVTFNNIKSEVLSILNQ